MRTKGTTMWTTVAVSALALTACGDDDGTQAEAELAGDSNGNGQGTENTDTEADEVGDDDGDDPPQGDADDDTDHENSDQGDEQTDDQGGDDDSAGTNDVTVDPEEAQQSVTYPLPEVDGEMTMGLHALEAGEEGLALTVSFVPEYQADEPATFKELHGQEGRASQNQYVLPTLHDRDNLKMYYVPTPDPNNRAAGWASSSADAWATNVHDLAVAPGESFALSANFPIPEDDINTVDVAVMPGVQDFKDVEIEWGDAAPEDSDIEDTDDEDAEDAEDDA